MLGRRVVVTGIGMLSPLGVGANTSWNRLLSGASGIDTISYFDASDHSCTIAGEIDWAGDREGVLNSGLAPKERRKVDDFIAYGVCAADEAVSDSKILESNPDLDRCGVLIGTGIGGLCGIAETAVLVHESSVRRISPHFVPGRLPNLASGYVSIKHGFRGPNHCVCTACASGSHAIGDSARMIAVGDADVMIAGGTESALAPIGLGGFIACRALTSKFNDQPQSASRPFDRDRSGFVIAEGAAMLVLEELDHALARSANIYAEITGYGMSGDAYHTTAPTPNGEGAERAMRAALTSARIPAEDVDYINAHGTSTPLGDAIELSAISRVFGSSERGLLISSTKSATGHALGATGALEAIFALLAIRDNMAPPTLNLDNPDSEFVEKHPSFDLVPHQAKAGKVDVVLSNSFGFGGTNSCLVISRYN